MTPEELIAEQDATITELRAEVASLQDEIDDHERTASDLYYEGVYDRIRAAWDAWALAELGTASPSHRDLQGRPELAALWEAVR